MDATEPERKMFALFNKLTLQFTDLSRIIEEDVSVLQNTARQTERVLLSELTYNADKLVEVSDAVDGVKLSFDLASEGAIRIGGKLSAAERERSHIDKSIELLGYIKIFQDTPTENFNNAVKATSTPQELRDCLPPGLQKKNWGTISGVLHDLKKILFELVSEDVKNAQNNIILVADRVELELLGEFENTIIDIISDSSNKILATVAVLLLLLSSLSLLTMLIWYIYSTIVAIAIVLTLYQYTLLLYERKYQTILHKYGRNTQSPLEMVGRILISVLRSWENSSYPRPYCI